MTPIDARRRNCEGLDQDPLWYKSGVIYEVHVRAFHDSNGDGTGDFPGLTEKLDYLKDLGVTAVWLLPFYPSPLKDDGYDIADYCDVHPMYGTLGDFKTFLREAHCRGLRVITELVLNHTSDQHPWFQRARRARPGSKWRDFYVWSDTASKYKDTRIIFKDVEVSNWTWDHAARAYYWHRFFSHQPDLNYDCPEVHQAMTRVVDFWFDLGVDGLRLDAVPYLYEREGTNCENLPETHAFLKQLRSHVDAKYDGRMLLAEANQWPEDAVAYFGADRGDECHMAFHFPLMPRLFMAVRMEDRLPIVDILEQTPPIPETSQWALFLRNHDELTLEMVTDEERDYMYRMYAQVRQARLNLGIRRRLAPLLGNDRRRIELLNALLFSLPGTPVLYYGDEIGLGENIYLGDRNGVRTPMQWSSDKNAGFSRANPQSLYLPIILDPEYHYEAVNVEAQLANPHSLLWWMRRMLALRKRWRALGEGKCEFLQPENRKILSYVLRHGQETILVVANLSRFVQPVELDLSAFKQLVPVELFGRMKFPLITDQPYFLTLGPHAFFWFSLEPKSAPVGRVPAVGAPVRLATITVAERWTEVLGGKPKSVLETVAVDYLKSQPWFCGNAKTIRLATLTESISLPLPDGDLVCLAFFQVDYVEGDSEIYAVPLAFAGGTDAERLRQSLPWLAIAELNVEKDGSSGLLFDGMGSAAFSRLLLAFALRRQRHKGEKGEVEAASAPALRALLGEVAAPEPAPAKSRQSYSSVTYGDKVVLKLFRRLEPGANPELELGGFLTTSGFAGVPPLVGSIEYRGAADASISLAVLHAFVPSAADAQKYTSDALGRYYDRVITWVAQGRPVPPIPAEPVKLLEKTVPSETVESIGTYLESARLLGVRTAELHLALASGVDNPAFAPEPFTPHYQRALFQSMRSLAVRNLRWLRKRAKTLPSDLTDLAKDAADLEPAIVQLYRSVLEAPLNAKRIRIHGDCQVGQVLWTGKDFVFVDFEGDLSLALTERRIKRSPLQDIARLVRSFHYAAYAGLQKHVERGSISHENLPKFEPWLRYWNLWVSLVCLRAYFDRIGPSELVPSGETELRAMLQAYLLHEVMGELGRGLDHPAEELRTPLNGIFYFAGRDRTARISALTGTGLQDGHG